MFFTWSFFAWRLSFHNKNVWKKRFLVSICLYLQNFTREYMTGKSLQLKMQSLFAKTATIFKNFSSIFSRYWSDWPAQKRLLSFLPPLSQTKIWLTFWLTELVYQAVLLSCVRADIGAKAPPLSASRLIADINYSISITYEQSWADIGANAPPSSASRLIADINYSMLYNIWAELGWYQSKGSLI